MTKVFFIIPNLGSGGAERVMVNIVRNMDRSKFRISVVLFEKKGVYLEALPGDVAVYDLGKKKSFDFFKIIIALARLIKDEKPDVVLSFLWYANLVTVLARKIAAGSGARVILSEHSTPSKDLQTARFGAVKRFFMKWAYGNSSTIVTVSEGVKKDMVSYYSLPPHKIHVIYNPVDFEEVNRLSGEPVDRLALDHEYVIVTVGRLVPAKGYDILLQALSKLSPGLSIRAVFLGEGPQRAGLEKIARELNLQEKTVFMGFRKNPFKYMKQGQVFVLSSLYEGFPNVIIEAMALGLPVVATRCPSGPEEIITDGEDGLLVPVQDPQALAGAIEKILINKELRLELADRGRANARELSVEKITGQYEELFLRH